MQTCELRDSMEGLRLEADASAELRVFRNDRQLFAIGGNFALRVFHLLAMFEKKRMHPEEVNCHGAVEFLWSDRRSPRLMWEKKRGLVMPLQSALETMALPCPMQLQTKEDLVHSAVLLGTDDKGQAIVLHKPGAQPIAIRPLERMLLQYQGWYSRVAFGMAEEPEREASILHRLKKYLVGMTARSQVERRF